MLQAIQRLEREQQGSGLPLSRFIDSIRPGKGKRKGRDGDDADETGEDGPLSGQVQPSSQEALLQVSLFFVFVWVFFFGTVEAGD